MSADGSASLCSHVTWHTGMPCRRRRRSPPNKRSCTVPNARGGSRYGCGARDANAHARTTPALSRCAALARGPRRLGRRPRRRQVRLSFAARERTGRTQRRPPKRLGPRESDAGVWFAAVRSRPALASGKRPISALCPSCGSPDHVTIPPLEAVSFEKDRKCTHCGTQYSRPTPLALILIGAIFLAIAVAIFVVEKKTRTSFRSSGSVHSC